MQDFLKSGAQTSLLLPESAFEVHKSFVTVFAELASCDRSTVINALAQYQVGLAIEKRF